MTSIQCSGLVTMVKKGNKTKLRQKFIKLPQGTDFATLTELKDIRLYGNYIFTRKALIVDVKIPSEKIGKETVRLINTHLSPYNTAKVVLIIDHTSITCYPCGISS